EKGFQLVANFILTEVTVLSNTHNINLIDCPVKPEQISKLMKYIDNGKISSKQAKDILNELWTSAHGIDEIIKNKNIEQISDEAALREISLKILDNFPKEVQDYNNGKDKLMGFFVGQIMKETKGKANPKILNKIVINLLEEKK
ncbi:MAG: Asp-tRNA(Asn)/Glu-tRNA(Gln) amidotransferase GatCAB subunit B, partial [Gammaproteobacteria bacterium]